MSLSSEPLQIVKVIDPVVDFKDPLQQKIVVQQGASNISFKRVPAPSISDNLTFSTTIPSGSFLSKKITFTCRLQFTFGANNVVSRDALVDSSFAPRDNPLMCSLINNAQIQLGNSKFADQFTDIVPVLARLNAEQKKRVGLMSGTPSQPDVAQNYITAFTTAKNPLQWSSNGNVYDISRGSFGLVRDPSVANNNTATAANFTYEFTEELALGCLNWSSEEEDMGFYGLTTFDLYLQLNPRNFCASLVPGDSTAAGLNVTPIGATFSGNSLTSLTTTIVGTPYITLKIMSPPFLERPIQKQIHPYYETQLYRSQSNTLVPFSNTAAPSTFDFSLNDVLHVIPSLILVFIRRDIANLGALSTAYLPQCYQGIQTMNISWNNSQPQLSQLSMYDLYQMSRKNGVDMSFVDFGKPVQYPPSTNQTVLIKDMPNQIGSIIAIRPGIDFPLGPDESIGKAGTFNISIRATGYQLDPFSPFYATQPTYALCMVTVVEGMMILENGKSYQQIGMLTGSDILRGQDAPVVNYDSIDSSSGGAIFSKVGRSLNRAKHPEMQDMKELKAALNKELKSLKEPKRKEMGGEGGEFAPAELLQGGRMTSRRNLRARSGLE